MASRVLELQVSKNAFNSHYFNLSFTISLKKNVFLLLGRFTFNVLLDSHLSVFINGVYFIIIYLGVFDNWSIGFAKVVFQLNALAKKITFCLQALIWIFDIFIF